MPLMLLAIIGLTVIGMTEVSGERFRSVPMERTVMIRDGVRLHTRTYLPGLGEYPVIPMRTPYGIGRPTWKVVKGRTKRLA